MWVWQKCINHTKGIAHHCDLYRDYISSGNITMEILYDRNSTSFTVLHVHDDRELTHKENKWLNSVFHSPPIAVTHSVLSSEVSVVNVAVDPFTIYTVNIHN